MNSFYGGKQGITYNIVERYDSVEKMCTCFSNGGSYTDVNYGEYVIIDTIKNNQAGGTHNAENGLLFRRGFDFDDTGLPKPDKVNYYVEILDQLTGEIHQELNTQAWDIAWSNWLENVGHGAIYVGQIVGPEGPAPEVRLAHWEDSDFDNIDPNRIIQPVSQTIAVKKENGVTSYDDYISAKSVVIRENGNITGVKIAFDFPEPVITVSAQSVSPYDTYNQNTDTHNNLGEDRDHYDEFTNVGNHESTGAFSAEYNKDTKQWKYSNLIHEHSKSGHSSGHQFYHNYDIAIPKGIHGNTIESITTKPGYAIDTKLALNDNPLATSQIEVDSNNNAIVNGDEYITFDLRNYDESAEGAITANQGRFPYRVINTISANLTNRTYFTAGVPKIGDIYKYTASGKTGLYAICINTGRSSLLAMAAIQAEVSNWAELSENLQNAIYDSKVQQLAADGKVIDNVISATAGDLNYNISIFKDNANSTIYTGNYLGSPTLGDYAAKWRVIRIPLQAPPQVFDIDYKAGVSDTIDGLRFVDYMYLDDNGKLHAVYVDNQAGLANKDQEIGFIDFIKSITYKDGLFTFNMLSGDPKSFEVNVIIDVKQVGDNICVLYSSETYRRELKKKYDTNDQNEYIVDYGKNIKYYMLTYEKLENGGITSIVAPYFVISPIDGKYHIFGKVNILDLIDLTSIRDNYPELELTLELKDTVFTKGWLADGFDPNENPSSIGWVVTCALSEENVKHYAFDFNRQTPQQELISIDFGGWLEEHYEEVRKQEHQNDEEWNWPIETGEETEEELDEQILQREKIIEEYEDIILSNLIINPNNLPHLIYIDSIPGIDEEAEAIEINKWFGSYWYEAQVISTLNIDASTLYRIMDEDTFKTTARDDIQSQTLNYQGLWFVLLGGKDE